MSNMHGSRLFWVGNWNNDIHCRINTASLWIYFTRISSIWHSAEKFWHIILGAGLFWFCSKIIVYMQTRATYSFNDRRSTRNSQLVPIPLQILLFWSQKPALHKIAPPEARRYHGPSSLWKESGSQINPCMYLSYSTYSVISMVPRPYI